MKRWMLYCLGTLMILMAVYSIVKLPDVEEAIPENVRKAYVANQFYSDDPEILNASIRQALSELSKTGKDVKALIVPHAGYVYSGMVAAQGFKQVEGEDFETVIIIGNNHAEGARYRGASVPFNVSHYETPLGKLALDVQSLKKEKHFLYEPAAHTTHVIEVELPFIQTVLGDVSIMPIVLSGLDEKMIGEIAESILNEYDEDTLIVVSSDFSHYHNYDEAVKKDTKCSKDIEKQDYSAVRKCEACGLDAISVLLKISSQKGWEAKIIDIKNSGDVGGDKSRVVGYSAIMFYSNNTDSIEDDEVEVGEAEQAFLLKMARETVTNSVTGKTIPTAEYEGMNGILNEKRGCFVTLNKHGNLRGCIGHIVPQKTLYECVIENARNAALKDRRFQPVSPSELDDIEIEVSVLTLPTQVIYNNSDELLENLRPMTDGVILVSGMKQSTFLPQVWAQFSSKEEFLGSLCKKQGSGADCWKDLSTKTFVYQAQVFD